MVAEFFTMLFRKVAAFAEWIGKLWVAIFQALWDLLKDGVCWVVEQFLDLAVAAAQSLDVSGIQTGLSAWGSIPGNVLEVCAALGLGTAFSVISAAIGIRLVLQLIPFTRLGS